MGWLNNRVVCGAIYILAIAGLNPSNRKHILPENNQNQREKNIVNRKEVKSRNPMKVYHLRNNYMLASIRAKIIITYSSSSHMGCFLIPVKRVVESTFTDKFLSGFK